MSEKKACCSCSSNEKLRLLFACSGAADLGLLADSVIRRLHRDGFGKAGCLAGMGADLSGFVQSAKAAETIVIDGCQSKCGSRICERHGVEHVSISMTDFGFKKGTTDVNDTVIQSTIKKIKEKINERKQ